MTIKHHVELYEEDTRTWASVDSFDTFAQASLFESGFKFSAKDLGLPCFTRIVKVTREILLTDSPQ